MQLQFRNFFNGESFINFIQLSNENKEIFIDKFNHKGGISSKIVYVLFVLYIKKSGCSLNNDS